MSNPRIAFDVPVAAVAGGSVGSAVALTMKNDKAPPSKDFRNSPVHPSDPGYWTKDRMRKAKPYPMPLAPSKRTRDGNRQPKPPPPPPAPAKSTGRGGGGPGGSAGGASGAPPRNP